MAQENAFFSVPNLTSFKAAQTIKQGLDQLPGVTSVSVNIESRNVTVDFDSAGIGSGSTGEQQIQRKLADMGFTASMFKLQAEGDRHA